MAQINWQVSLATLEKNILKFQATTEMKIQKLADYWAVSLADKARAGAPWTDRTGNARSGLFGAVEKGKGRVTIYLSHGERIDYGVYLELNHAGRFAIIWPTITDNADKVMASFRKIFK